MVKSRENMSHLKGDPILGHFKAFNADFGNRRKKIMLTRADKENEFLCSEIDLLASSRGKNSHSILKPFSTKLLNEGDIVWSLV